MVVREPVPMDDLHVEPGWTVTTRMPTVEERQEHDIPDGVPVFVVLYPSGAGDIYPGDRYRLSVN